jgi:hypothetical protein
MAHGHDDVEIIEPKDLELPRNFTIVCAVLVAIGVVAFLAGLGIDSHRAWHGYLIGFWFTLSLALSGPFIVATQHLSIAGWSASIRRVPEAFGNFIYPAAVLAIVGAVGGAHSLFHWTHEEVQADPIIARKLGFLNMEAFIGTTIATVIVWCAMVFLMRKTSLKQDEEGDYQLTEHLKWISAGFLFVFVVGFSFMSWYWLMSLEPHWFSTMFQVYTFAGLFQSGLALTAIIVLVLGERGYFGNLVGVKQIHDIGKLLFGFTTFYAYIGFCQFLLIWYANIPEEDLWYVHRLEHGWAGFTLILPFVKFIIPFLILLPQNHKKNQNNILFYVAIGIMCAQLYEVWYWVAPTPPSGADYVSPAVPYLELPIALGFIGAFIYVVGRSLAAQNLVPRKDPFLHESLPHQH